MEKDIKKTIKPKVIKNIDNKDSNKISIDNEKDELLRKTKEQEEVILNLTKQNNESMSTLGILQKQMQDMQQAFIQMQSNSQNTSNSNTTSSKSFEIGSRLINGITLYDPKRVVEREIPSNQIIEVNEYEIEMLLKSPLVKNLIKDDVVYFVDKDDYERFKIYEHSDLSDEFIMKLVTDSSADQLTSKLDKLTKNKRNHQVLHSIFYRIVELTTDGKLHRMNYNSRNAIEKYFRFSIDNGAQMVERIKEVK